MPYTDEQIATYARALEAKGAPAADIESFVSSAKAEQGGATAPAPQAPAPQQAPQQAPQAQPGPAQVDAGPDVQKFIMSGESFIPQAMAKPNQFGQSADSAAQTAKAFASGVGSVAKYGIPIAAAAMAPEFTVPAMAFRSLAGGVGTLVGNFLNRKPTTPGELVRDTAMFAAPVSKVNPAGILSPQTIANFAKGGLAAGGTAITADLLGKAADAQALPSYDDLKASFKDSLWPAAIGATAFGMAGRLMERADVQAQADAGRKALSELGMSNPTLGDVIPKYAGLQAKVAATDPALAAKIAQSRLPIKRAFLQTIGDTPVNEDLATKLQPLMSKMDEASNAYDAAQAGYDKAMASAVQAGQNVNVPLAVRSQLVQQATQEAMKDVSAKALAIIGAQSAGKDVISMTGSADSLTDLFKNVHTVRTAIAGDLLSQTGIPATQPLFAKTSLLDAARGAMGDMAESQVGKRILQAIDQSKLVGNGPVNKQAQNLLANLGPQYRAQAEAQLAAQTPEAVLSLQEFQQLRNKISDALPDPSRGNATKSDQRLAALAYGGMNQAIRPVIANTFGPQALSKLDEFSGFWAKTSRLMDDPIGRAFLQGNVNDQTISGIANKVVKGEADEIANVKDFLATVGDHNPQVGAAAYNTFMGHVKNSLLNSNMDGPNIDYSGLAKQLSGIAARKDMPFDVADLGFGDKQNISDWAKVASNPPPYITNADITDAFQAPAMQKAVLGTPLGATVRGPSAGGVLRQELAIKAFNNRVDQAAALAATGATEKARMAYGEAAVLADKAKLTRDQAQKAVMDAQNNPVIAAFKGLGSKTLTNQPGIVSGGGTVNNLIMGMKTDEAAGLIKGLRESNPDLADQIQRSVLAGELAGMVKTDNALPGSIRKLNVAQVRDYFNPEPTDYANSNLAKLRAVIGPAKVDEFRKVVTALSNLDDAARQGIIENAPNRAFGEAVGIGGGLAKGNIGGAYQMKGLVPWMGDLIARSQYSLASHTLMDSQLFQAMNRSNGNVGKALSSLPLQKAFLIMHDPSFQRDMAAQPPQKP